MAKAKRKIKQKPKAKAKPKPRRKRRLRHPSQIKLDDQLQQLEAWIFNARISATVWAADFSVGLRSQSLACDALLRINRIQDETLLLMAQLKIKPIKPEKP